jgi:hypothetical protein
MKYWWFSFSGLPCEIRKASLFRILSVIILLLTTEGMVPENDNYSSYKHYLAWMLS